MSSQSSTYSSNNGQQIGQAYKQTTRFDPSGTHVQTTSQTLGEPVVQETRYFDGEERKVLEGERTVGAKRREAGRIQKVKEVSEVESRK